MIKSLRARVLALLAAFGLVIAACLALIGYMMVRDYYSDVQYKRASEFAERLIDMHPDMWAEYEANPSNFGDKLRQYILYAPNIGLYLLGNDGQVLASAGERQLYWSNFKVNLQPVRSSLARDPNQPIFAADPDMAGTLCLVAARPLGTHHNSSGWLYVVARYADADTAPSALLNRYAIKTALKVAMITLAVGMLLTMGILALMTRPLGALTRVAENIKESGFEGTSQLPETEIPHVERDDEIGRLGRAFKDMLARLRTEMRRVKKADAQRREMIASVSHDLRTPLTALTAQLQTIHLKGDSLDIAQREQLFERASHNAEHLKRLTDSLAEIGRLDNPEFKAAPEPMALGELADDVTQRFASRAEDKNVRLNVDYPDGMPLSALDADLIERALYNLIDNALRVTPSGGEVKVGVVRDKQGLRVEVSDTGPGVAEQDRQHVFDLFYQASKHRETRGSSGLGLSVVRRVAELHGGHAGVNSKAGAGSTFYIQLPAGA